MEGDKKVVTDGDGGSVQTTPRSRSPSLPVDGSFPFTCPTSFLGREPSCLSLSVVGFPTDVSTVLVSQVGQKSQIYVTNRSFFLLPEGSLWTVSTVLYPPEPSGSLPLSYLFNSKSALRVVGS